MKVAQDVLQVLDRAEIDGEFVRLVGQLERPLYVQTNKVLEAAGGRWNRGAKAHVFPGLAADALDPIFLTGEVSTAQEFGFFETPSPVVDRLLQLADLAPGMRVLEPSAGRGAIALRLAEAGCTVACVEVQIQHQVTLGLELERLGLAASVLGADFLDLAPEAIFDRVVMNPPFARQADVAHVTHALRFLKPGGLLVSVMASGVTFRSNRATVEFRDLVDDSGGFFEELPPDAFKASGTGVRTVLAKIPG